MLWTGDGPAGREMKVWVGEWAFRGDWQELVNEGGRVCDCRSEVVRGSR